MPMTDWAHTSTVEALLHEARIGVAMASLAMLLVLALRPWVRSWAGAVAQYQLWCLVPAMFLARLLPAPPLPELAQVPPPPVRWVDMSTSLTTAMHTAGADHSHIWLMVWLGGVVCVLLLAAALHARFMSTLRPGGSNGQQKRLWRLPAGASAACVGWWPPRLALPVDFQQRFTRQERQLVLAHERVHAQRGDNLWSLLALLLTALLWFSPLAWWSLWRFRADQELACDASVLRRHPHAARLYTHTLLKAQQAQPVQSSGAWGSRFTSAFTTHPLIERITMLPCHLSPPSHPGFVSLLMLAVCGLAYAAPAAVSVAAPPPVEVGYSKLRLDVQFTVNNQTQAPAVLVLDMGHPTRVPLTALTSTSASGHVMEVKGMPVADGTVELTVKLKNEHSGHSIGPLRLIVADGAPAGVRHQAEGAEPSLQLSLLPRVIRTRAHDTSVARIELLRDIEAGHAPGPVQPR
jgi:beta-lactamase regulating signal transducer with metallopeptidase domain